jgi:hypothetical protein
MKLLARFEPWAWPAFAIGLATAGLLLFLGWRPGGGAAVLAYAWGPLVIGGASAVLLVLALLWCLRRRPFVQRGRIAPFAVLAASLWLCSLPFPYPSSYQGKPSTERFRLPFEGPALVRFGGEQRVRNPLLFDPARRFGVCFEATAPGGLTVVAPASGSVVERTTGRAGERLVVALPTGEYLVLDGLSAEGTLPDPGTRLTIGQVLGRASQRLFVSVMDGPRLERSEGIPMRFWDYVVDGRVAEVGVPVPPQRVWAPTEDASSAVPGAGE